MAVTNFSPLLGLALPTTGDLSGTWGATVNDSITQLLDSAVAGTTTLSADADVTLSTTNGAANQARNAIILWTASNGATTRNITAPAQSKAYLVINSGTGSIVLRGAGPTTGVTVPASARALVAWNGSDFVKIVSNPVSLTTDVTGTLPIANGGTGTTSTTFANLTTNVTGTLPIANGGTGTTSTTFANLTTNVTGTLPVGNGGTGATSLTANNVLLGNGTSALQVVAPGTTGNVLTSDGTTWTSAAVAAGDVTLTGTQTLTNKTISADNNTLSGIAASSFVLSNGSGNIDGAAAQKAIPAGDVVGTTDTQTLTNKRVTPRSVDIASAATITPTGDTADQYEVTALAAGATIAAPSGTPTDGQKLVLRIKDNGTARALTWTTTSGAYRAVGVTLPTTTVISKVLYVGCVYNAQDSFWDVLAVAQLA